MRVFTRIGVVLLAVVVLSAPTLLSQPLQAGCPLTLVANNSASSPFYQSPHGVFRSGSRHALLPRLPFLLQYKRRSDRRVESGGTGCRRVALVEQRGSRWLQ